MTRDFICLAIFFSSFFVYGQNINSVFPNFDKTGMGTDILYNPSSINNINDYKQKTHDLYSFYQVYKSLAFSDFEQRLPDLQIIKNSAMRELMSLNIPIALIYSEYETSVSYTHLTLPTKA